MIWDYVGSEISVVKLTEESHTPVDPVVLALVNRQLDAQHVVGRVTSSGQLAPSCTCLVHCNMQRLLDQAVGITVVPRTSTSLT